MKHVSISIIFLISIATCSAQTMNFAAHAGFGLPTSDISNGGFLVSLDPSISFQKNFSIGLSLQTMYFDKGMERFDYYLYNRELSHSGKLFLQYQPSKLSIAPFLGAGIGWYNVGPVTAELAPGQDRVFIKRGNKFGYFLRGGLEFNRIILMAEFNLVPETRAIITPVPRQNLEEAEVINNYSALTLGYRLTKR